MLHTKFDLKLTHQLYKQNILKPLNIPNMRSLQFFILLFMLAIASGCSRFYVPASSNLSHKDAIRKAKSENRYFILRDSLSAYSLTNVEVDDEKNIISCSVDRVSPEHMVYLNAKKNKYTYSKNKGQDVVLNELHIFSSRVISTSGTGRTEIPLLSVSRIEEINYDAQRTKKQHKRVWLISGGIVVGTVLLVWVSAAAVLAAAF